MTQIGFDRGLRWLLLVVAAVTPCPSQTTGMSEPERMAADTQRTTPGGASLTAPAGWSIRSGSSLLLIEAPEADGRVAIFDIAAADAGAAVAAAWAAYRPDAKRTVKLASPFPPRDGWEERHDFEYETSPNERAVVDAFARRAGKMWTVAIVDGTIPTFEKRGAALSLLLQSLRPKGYQRESFADRKALALDENRIANLKQFVRDAMDTLEIPGASLALIDRGKVVFEGGFGVRELGKPTPVEANTLFMAASNTKGMTTLLLARLVDEKKLRWDQPVTQVYPSFKLGDEPTTRQVLVKHLICACTGLPRQDLEWIFENKGATASSSIGLLAAMQPTSRFGEVFQYSNIMASAAGFIGGYIHDPDRELGAAYDAAMEKKIFRPLGMKSTPFDMARAEKGNHARPHGEDVDGKPAVAKMAFNYSIAPHRPAGGVWTSAHDLIRYCNSNLREVSCPRRCERGGPVFESSCTSGAVRVLLIGCAAFRGRCLCLPNHPSRERGIDNCAGKDELGRLNGEATENQCENEVHDHVHLTFTLKGYVLPCRRLL